MQVKDRMTHNPFTAKPTTPVSDAREMMKKDKIHRLPVIDNDGHLVGIITEKDILCASPSPATSLDVWEISSLLAKLMVSEIMTPQPIACSPDTPIEEAARVLSDNDIGGLPVTNQGLLVGIITESDLFKVFIELFAIREKGIRITFVIPDHLGELASISGAIRDAGGNILSFGIVRGEYPTNKLCIAKVSGITEQELEKAVAPFIEKIEDIRLM